MSIISEKTYAEQSVSNTISAFYRTMKIGAAWKQANGSKQKGIPFSVIFLYLLQLVYTGKSMFEDLRSAHCVAVCCKDTVYRLLNTVSVNWMTFLLCISNRVIAFLSHLTSDQRKAAFVVDDTFYGRPYGKKVELCCNVYDHAAKGQKYKAGFRLLTLGWTDGDTFIPVTFRHMSSQDQKHRYCEARKLDRRYCGSRIRRQAVKPMPELLLFLLISALRAGITASYILFDSWFFSPEIAIQLHTLGLHTVSRVKNTSKMFYLHEGEKKTAAQIYRNAKKTQGSIQISALRSHHFILPSAQKSGKALKSYLGTGLSILFAIIVHPITFYSSSFLDMSTQFIPLSNIVHSMRC